MNWKAGARAGLFPFWESAPPRSWPQWSAIAPPPFPWRLPCASLVCQRLSGRWRSNPGFGIGSSRFGPRQVPALPQHTPCCWPPYTVSVSLGPRRRWPSGKWYRQSILAALWNFAPERFTWQAFGDAFEQILPEEQQDLPWQQDPLEKAQLAVLGLWKEKQLVRRRLLTCDLLGLVS